MYSYVRLSSIDAATTSEHRSMYATYVEQIDTATYLSFRSMVQLRPVEQSIAVIFSVHTRLSSQRTERQSMYSYL